MRVILHITERSAWEQARSRGLYTAASLQTEGFIHCSTIAQTVDTANHFFRGQRDLVLLCIDEDRIATEVRYEPPSGGPVRDPAAGALFPHLYGPLPLDAVVQVLDFPAREDGTFTLPPQLA